MATNERIAPVEEVQLLRAAACDWRLSRGDVAVLAVILQHCNAERSAFPGPKKISGKARLAVTNVKASILRLERYRYLKVERRGLRKKNRYFLLDSPNCPTRRARKPSFRTATGRADKPSSEDASGHAGVHGTGHTDMKNLVMPARHEVAFKSPLKSQSASLPSEEEQEQQSLHAEAQRLAVEEQKAVQRQGVLAEYLQVLEAQPKRAASMLTIFPYLAEMIEDKAA